MAQEEVLDIPGFGYVLMPGQFGFSGEHSWRLNPSYVPPQLLARIAQEQPIHPWAELLENTPRFLLETSPLGLAPDWVTRTQKDWSFSALMKKSVVMMRSVCIYGSACCIPIACTAVH
jgi:endoglucanase